MIKIMWLLPENKNYIKQCAMLLTTNFNNFDDIKTSKKVVLNSLCDSKINIIAVNEYTDNVLGWISGSETYNEHVWEIQPLVVRKDCHNCGIGRELLSKFERTVSMRGGITILLETEGNGTSIEGTDIYSDITKYIKDIKNFQHNAYEFYLKCGFKICGFIPDAGKVGKHDILLAKRIKEIYTIKD